MDWLARLVALFTGAADADARQARADEKLRELAREDRIEAARLTGLATERTRRAEVLERRAVRRPEDAP